MPFLSFAVFGFENMHSTGVLRKGLTANLLAQWIGFAILCTLMYIVWVHPQWGMYEGVLDAIKNWVDGAKMPL